MIYIGRIIKKVLKEQGLHVTDFAKQINCSRRNAYVIFNKPTIDTGMLLRISRVLKHNFFMYFAADPEMKFNGEETKMVEDSENNRIVLDWEARVRQLEEKVSYLEEINALLREKTVRQ